MHAVQVFLLWVWNSTMPLLYWRHLSNLSYQESMFELVLQQIGLRIVWYLLLTLFKKKKQRKNEGKINLEFISSVFKRTPTA